MIYSRKGDLDASFEYYQPELVNYRATVGGHYYHTSQARVKLAEYQARRIEIEAMK